VAQDVRRHARQVGPSRGGPGASFDALHLRAGRLKGNDKLQPSPEQADIPPPGGLWALAFPAPRDGVPRAGYFAS
jgi:hypothetical protein